MMVVPAETEETINELLSFCVEGDIIIDHGNSNFKDSRRRARKETAKLASNILTVVLVVVFTVWSVDTVLWLVVQILQYPPAVSSLMHSVQDSMPLPRTYNSDERPKYPEEYGWIHAGGPGAGHFCKDGS